MARRWRTLGRRELARLRESAEFQLYDGFPQGRALDVRSADGTTIHTEVFGPEDGYPVVLTHGFCCRIDFWANQIAALSADCRVIAFDHRGHGRSARPARHAWTVEHLREDLAAVVRTALRPGERALIAGHSMGGITIQAWAHGYPDEVARFADSIALINSSPGGIGTAVAATMSGGGLREPISALLDRAVPGAAHLFGGMPVPRRLPRRSSLMSPVAIGAAARPAARALIQELVLTTPSSTRGGFLRTLLRVRDGQFGISWLTAPTLVIGSTDDQLLGFAASERLVRRFPNSAGLVEIPGGHSGPVEQPDAVTAELRKLAGLHPSCTPPISSTRR
ncbi:alpha/beta fold hydrolase [Nocardia sp. CA-151230]|uniref:alpha/beta fold hydrolase n=1 Tax=Nocardia sp. CA-151230 TaxID=3239982 RepID=UPI003D8C1C65